MPNSPTFDLRGKRIEDTFQQILQYDTSLQTFYNGLGASTDVTASFAKSINRGITGSVTITDLTNVATLVIHGSDNTGGGTTTFTSTPAGMIIDAGVGNTLYINTPIMMGNYPINTTNNAGRFNGTASYSDKSISSSYAFTSSVTIITQSITFVSQSNFSVSSSWASQSLSSSYPIYHTPAGNKMVVDGSGILECANLSSSTFTGGYALESSPSKVVRENLNVTFTRLGYIGTLSSSAQAQLDAIVSGSGVKNAVSASWAPFTDSPYALSSSWASQSLSASWASQSLSASWAPVPVSASWASSSFSATTASFASRSLFTTSASYASASTSASWAPVPVSASWASQSLSASWAPVPVSASWASRSFAATSASWASSSVASISASWASSSVTASYVQTASWAINVVSGGTGTTLVFTDTTAMTQSWGPSDYYVNFFDYTKSLYTPAVNGMYRLDVVAVGWITGSGNRTIYFGAKFIDEIGAYSILDDTTGYQKIDYNWTNKGLTMAGTVTPNAYSGGLEPFRYYFSYLFSGKAGNAIEYYWTDGGTGLGDGANPISYSMITKASIEKLT